LGASTYFTARADEALAKKIKIISAAITEEIFFCMKMDI